MRNDRSYNEWMYRLPPAVKSRLAGMFFLLYAGIGGTGYFLSQSLIAGNDSAATASNILVHEQSFRIAIAANLTSAACYLVFATLMYDLFRPVDRSAARLAIFFLLISCAMGAIDSLFQLAALDVLHGEYLKVFAQDQAQALALLFLKENIRLLDMGLIFFGLFWIVSGYLFLRSTFFLRLLGVVAIFDGLWYMAHLYRPLAAALLPYVMIVPGAGSMVIMLWMTIRGVDTQRWKEQAASSADFASRMA